MAPSEMADAQQKEAFRAVSKNDPSTLAGITGSCPKQQWEQWRNRSGQTLIALCKERGAFKAYAVLAKALDLSMEVGKGDAGEPSKKAFRAVAQDDMAALVEALNGLSAQKWLQWRNKAGKDLLTMSSERKSKGVYATLRRALVSPLTAEGLVTEAVKAQPIEVKKPEPTPIAAVAVDLDGDGKADVIVAGVDKDKDGIPDVLEDPEEVKQRAAAIEMKPVPTLELPPELPMGKVSSLKPPNRKQSPPPLRKSGFADPGLEAMLKRQADKNSEDPDVRAAAQKSPMPSPRGGSQSPRPKDDSADAQAKRVKSAEDAKKRTEERKAKEKAEQEMKDKNKAELNARLAKQAEKAAGTEIVGQGSADPNKTQPASAAKQKEQEAAKEAAEKAAKEEAEKKAAKEADESKEAATKEAAAKEAAAKEAAENSAKEEAEKKAKEEAEKKAAAEKTAKEEAEKKAQAEAAAKKAAEEKAKIPPPMIKGKLGKKGKGGMFRKAWDQRYGVMKDGVFSYYKEEKDVGKEAQGVLDFRPCACEAVPEPEDKGGTQFIIRPKSGPWANQTFDGSAEGRAFVFDSAGSEHGRSAWIASINAHCEWAMRQKK